MNSGINLLTTNKRVSALTPYISKLKILRLIAMIMLFGVSVAAVIIFIFIQVSPLPALQKQRADSVGALSQFHPQMSEIAYINERLKSASAVMSQRAPFDDRIASLNAKTPPGLSITNIAMKKTNITLTATATSLATVDAFLTNLTQAVEEKKEYSEVLLNSLSKDEENGKFTLTIKLVL